jgi:hypothetical protein
LWANPHHLPRGASSNTGSEAKAFAKVMREHTLEATGGQTYAQMARFLDANGRPTNDEKAAAKDPKSGTAVANPARNIWVTETALTTALNTAYFADSTTTFVIAVGGALLLVGIGFLVLIVVAGRRVDIPLTDNARNDLEIAA